MSVFDDFATLLAPTTSEAVGFRLGIWTSGGMTIAGVVTPAPMLASYSPTVGDQVLVLVQGNQHVVLGRIA